MTKKQNIIPIIFLGGPRNGTTWLGNIFNEVFGIPTASHPLHYGFHESNTQKHQKHWGEFNTLDEYFDFLALYSSYDYFNLVKGSLDYFYEHPQKDFLDFYFALMDQYAQKQSCDHWCTKLDPNYYIYPTCLSAFLKRISERYEKIKYVAIQREYNAYFQSYLRMNGASFDKRQRFQLVAFWLAAARYVVYYRVIGRLISEKKGLFLQFKDLKQTYRFTIQQIEIYLNLPSNQKITNALVNTSFYGKERMEKANGVPQKIYFFLNGVPLLAKLILLIYEYLKPQRLPVYRKLYKAKYCHTLFMKELQQSNEKVLIDYLNLKEGIKQPDELKLL